MTAGAARVPIRGCRPRRSCVPPATPAGVLPYRSCGFVGRSRSEILYPDGVELEALLMDRAVSG